MKEVTLLYVIKDGQMLLIKSKRGVSKGKWNGPGGHLNSGETPLEAAVRETLEETGIVPLDPEFMGVNEFYIRSECAMRAHIFVAREFEGEPQETEEGVPQWFPLDAIPLGEMWPDDEIWFPLMLEGKKFSGRFYYDEDYRNMLRHEIEILENGR